MRKRPVLVAMNSLESAELTVSEPTIGGSPSGSIDGTARSAAAPSEEAPLSSPQPAISSASAHPVPHESPSLTAPDSTRTIMRARTISSSIATHSSTAWARSIPAVPAITQGMPRAVNRRMSAP